MGLDRGVGAKPSIELCADSRLEPSGFAGGKYPMKALLAAVCFCLIASAAAGQTQLRFVTWKPETPAVWEQLIADFERRHPGVKVIREVGPHSSTEFHDLVTQKLRNHDAEMDVFLMDVIWPSEFAAAGWALPLDSFFPVAQQEEFFPAPIAANRYRRRIYGVPLFVDAGLLYFRKDLLAKYRLAVPRTWPELVEQARLILAGERDPYLTGYSGQFKQYEGLVCNMMEFIISNGATLWDEENLRSTIDSAGAKQAVRFVRDQIIRRIAQRGVLAYEEPESLTLFAQGKAIFHRNWPYAWEVANDASQSKIVGRVGMAPLPAFPGHKSVAALGGWQLGISRFSRQAQLAWEFVEHMTSSKAQKEIALATGRGPARRTLYRDSELLAKLPHFRKLYETFTLAEPRPVTPVYLPLSNIMQRYFSSAIAIADSDIDQLAGSAARNMDRVLSLLQGGRRP
jgi:multiple sugar transport system substrate-binding protein